MYRLDSVVPSRPLTTICLMDNMDSVFNPGQNTGRVVSRSIVNNDDLKVLKRLRKHRIERVPYKVCPVKDRDDDTEKWHTSSKAPALWRWCYSPCRVALRRQTGAAYATALRVRPIARSADTAMGATGPSHASVATRQVSEEPGALRNALADNRRAILKFPEAQAIRAHVCSGILFPLQVGVGTCMAGSPRRCRASAIAAKECCCCWAKRVYETLLA